MQKLMAYAIKPSGSSIFFLFILFSQFLNMKTLNSLFFQNKVAIRDPQYG